MSKKLSFDLGVIQGTLSGPQFFNYYINDLFTDTETTRHSSFDDDTTIATADTSTLETKAIKACVRSLNGAKGTN